MYAFFQQQKLHSNTEDMAKKIISKFFAQNNVCPLGSNKPNLVMVAKQRGNGTCRRTTLRTPGTSLRTTDIGVASLMTYPQLNLGCP